MARNIVRGTSRRAVALVEFAVVVILMLWLVLGVIEFGWMILKSQQITNAARQGARIGARVDAQNADVTAAIAAVMTAAGMPDYDDPILEPADIEALGGGEHFSVTVRASYANIGLGVFPVAWLPLPDKLGAQVTMAKEGYNLPP